MSGQWPPEWEDPDDGHSDAGLPDREHPDAGYSDDDLSEVTSLLASVRGPALPATFEARISAAIAAEAAARATTEPRAAAEPAGPLTAAAGADDAKDRVRSADPEEFSPATAGGPSAPAGRRPRRGARTSRSAARASRPGTSRPDGRRRRRRMPSMQAASWVLVSCLVLAGFGFLVTRGSGSSASSSYAASAASSQSASAPAGASVQQPAAGRASQAQPGDANDKPSATAPTGFLVYSTGTSYEQSTLAGQVRVQLSSHDFGSLGPAAADNSASATAPASSAASTSGVGGSTPSPGLRGCVSKVTGGAAPSLVDRASYDGIPAYIIAVPTRVWVVRLGCTATDTQLIAAVPLGGEPGISAP
jgi:hypothetical protein